MGISIVVGWAFTSNLFTLGFTKFNMVMSLLTIALSSWYFTVNYKRIALILKARLEESLNRLFKGTNTQPLYKVFYGFNHTNTLAWVKWIKNQSQRQQERAFSRLAEYLQEPPNELGSIAVEVVKAILAFEHDNSYEVLAQLLKNSGEKWGQYKVLNLFYEETAISLIKLNEKEAKKLLLNELSEIKNVSDVDTVKSYILSALANISNKEEISRIFRKIILDKQQNLYIREKAIVIIKENFEANEFYTFLIKLFLRFLSLNNLNQDDFDVYNSILHHSILFFNDEKFNSTIWNLWCKAFKHRVLAEKTAGFIASKIKDPKFAIAREKLQALLELEVKEIFRDALIQRFNLSKEEIALVKTAEENQNILDHCGNKKQIFETYTPTVNHSLPQILEANYANFSSQVRKLQNKMLLITGKAKLEKLYFAELLAKELNKKFLYVDADTLLLSPDKMDELMAVIDAGQGYFIYLENIFAALVNAIDTEKQYRFDQFNKVLFKMQHSTNTITLASIPIDIVDIYDKYPKLASLIKALPNEQFASSTDISTANARFKQKVYAAYEIQLQDARDFSALKLEELLYKTEDMSSVAFVNYFLQYLRISLLTEGKLLALNNYEFKVKKELV